MKKVRVGVVGAGAIGENHIRVLSALDDNAELAAVFETDPVRVAEIQDRYDVPVVDSLDALIDAVDAATVATPTVSHLEVGARLLRAGRHVLVEKPIADTTEAARELVQLAKDQNRILQVGHVERFNPVLRELEQTMNEPRFIEAHRLSPFPNRSIDIGVVLDLMIHDLEIILHLVRSEVESIDAVGVPVLTRREDIANARVAVCKWLRRQHYRQSNQS